MDVGEAPVPISRVFARGEGEDYRQVVETYSPFLCAACSTKHRSESAKAGLPQYISRLWGGEGSGISGTALLFGSIYFIQKAVEESVWLHLRTAAFCLLVGAWFIWFNWKKRSHVFVGPPTPTMAGFEFTDSFSPAHDEAVVTFRFQSAKYAEAFRELNRSRLWDEASGEAMAARQKRVSRRKRKEWTIQLSVLAVVVAVLLSLLIEALDL